jgi:hypothetical protein
MIFGIMQRTDPKSQGNRDIVVGKVSCTPMLCLCLMGQYIIRSLHRTFRNRLMTTDPESLKQPH